MNGFLCIDKPTGITSRDVVNRIQRHVRPTKVGHAGTLDPLATGVLVVAVGRATRLVPYVQRMKKRYTASFELGKTSDTEDISGQITTRNVSTPPSETSVAVACVGQVGDIMQRPPAYSAIRVNGKRAYDLARQGKKVELKERLIVIHSIDLLEYQFPGLNLEVCCGSGTYIRSLGRDIGEELGCGALMTALRRTAIGPFGIERSKSIDQMVGIESIRSHLAPLTAGVATLPRLTVDKPQELAISYGKKITLYHQEKELAAISEEGELVAVLACSKDDEIYRPAINFIAK